MANNILHSERNQHPGRSCHMSSQTHVAAGPHYWLKNHLESNSLVSAWEETLVQAFLFFFLLSLALTMMRTVMKFPCAVPQKLPFLLTRSCLKAMILLVNLFCSEHVPRLAYFGILMRS